MFYAPWCGHCKSMKKDYALAARRLADGGHASARLATVDATVQTALSRRFDVRGFPTLRHFTRGALDPEPYDRRRTADDLVDYMTNRRRDEL